MNYSVIKADIKINKNDIGNIWEKNYPGILKKKYEWIYEKNPATIARVWLVKHEDSGLNVGVIALFPRQFVINGKSVTGSIVGDLLVNKDHRSVGPALLLQRNVLSAVREGTVDFIYSFPNKSSEPILKRAGYKVLGEKVRLVKVLRTLPLLLKLPFGKYWGPLLSPFLNYALRLFSFETWHSHRKNYVCEEVKEFDDRFDILWENINSSFKVIGERKANYLKWKFLNAPHSTNKIYAVFNSSKSQIKGYIVYHHIEKSIEIRDFLFLEDKKAIFVLMANFLRHARTLKTDSVIIELLENKEVVTQMKQFGFVDRKDNQNIYLFCSENLLKEFPFFDNSENWFLLQSDDDM